MKIYINATGNISPQKTFGHQSLLPELVEYKTGRLSCIEPEYKDYIDIKLIRRMSRIIKMGVASASACLQEAGVSQPDAIVTGTAYGCLEDTGAFITRMVEHNEELLTPTAFIQSTHNTIGAQIALMLQCKNYNNAFVHRGFSFESALLDAAMLLNEGAAENVLVGGIDEITDISHTILTRLGLYKRNPVANTALYTDNSKGTIAGEGAAFFLLENKPSDSAYAVLEGMATFYKPADQSETEKRISTFLTEHEISPEEIDLIVTGKNGDSSGDKLYAQLEQSLFKNTPVVNYKHLCGEYPTATSFAIWLAANMIKTNSVPVCVGHVSVKSIKRILVYNHYQQIHHALFLLSAC